MKLTTARLKKLIREELNRINENEMTPEQAMEELEQHPDFQDYMYTLGAHMGDDIEASDKLYDLEDAVSRVRDELSAGKDEEWVKRFDQLYYNRTDAY